MMLVIIFEQNFLFYQMELKMDILRWSDVESFLQIKIDCRTLSLSLENLKIHCKKSNECNL